MFQSKKSRFEINLINRPDILLAKDISALFTLMEGKLILGYWAIRGLSERIRQLMEYLGLSYAEELYEGAEGRAKWF